MVNRMKYRIKVIRKLYPYVQDAKRYFFLYLLGSIIMSGLQFATPMVYGIFIDDVIVQKNVHKLYVVIIGYLSLFVVEVIMSYITTGAKLTLINTTVYNVRHQIFKNFFTIPFEEYASLNIGEMKMRIDDDTNYINEYTETQTVSYLLAYIMMSACVIILFLIDWRLALFSSIVVPLTFVMDNVISRREKKLVEEQRENQKQWTAWLHEYIQGWREVKALGIAKHEAIRFFRFAHIDMVYNAKWINYWTARALVIPQIKDEFLMKLCLYFLGGLLIINNKLGISDLLVFAMYYQMFSEAVKSVSGADADLQSGIPYTDRLLDSLKNIESPESSEGLVPDLSNTIEFRNVSYKYPGTERYVLNDFNLCIKKGERIVIVGKSGSGKSTLMKLIAGMIEPTKGQVLYSGVNIRKIDFPVLYSRIGFVMQDNVLFHDTIKENLLYGKQDAAEEEVCDACKKAGIYDDIMKMQGGFNTIIGEKGSGLSGGQKQRLVLARLFLQDKDIFIFDEATSGLDQNTENIILDTISKIPKDKTIITVTHRESALQENYRVIKCN